MISRLYLTTLDYMKFTFGAMLTAALAFAIISLGHDQPKVLAYTFAAIVLIKILGTALSNRGSLKHRIVMNLFSFLLPFDLLLNAVVFLSPRDERLRERGHGPGGDAGEAAERSG